MRTQRGKMQRSDHHLEEARLGYFQKRREDVRRENRHDTGGLFPVILVFGCDISLFASISSLSFGPAKVGWWRRLMGRKRRWGKEG